MGPGTQVAFAALLLLSFVGSAAQAGEKPSHPWSKLEAPSDGESEAIGGFGNGCLTGGVAIPAVGVGYQGVRRSRGRYFGHRRLVDFITAYGRKIQEAGLDRVLLGDLAQPRGGPMSWGHASHQIGLDVDIWLSRPTVARQRPLTEAETEEIDFPSMVNLEDGSMHLDHWSNDQETMLRLAASFPEVDRIFVSAAIKRALCDAAEAAGAKPGSEARAWLHKIRPWWGHTGHFHVRVGCPRSDGDCQPQKRIVPGDGCEHVDWFMKREVWKPPKKKKKRKKKRRRTLPERCQIVFEAPSRPTPAPESANASPKPVSEDAAASPKPAIDTLPNAPETGETSGRSLTEQQVKPPDATGGQAIDTPPGDPGQGGNLGGQPQPKTDGAPAQSQPKPQSEGHGEPPRGG